MSRPRTFIFVAATLSAALWTHACGDGTTGPPAPPPDPPRPTTVTLSPATAELTALGATVQFSAEVRDQNGQAMAGATVTWASSAPDVATVNASGLATATGNGMATITATAGAASGTATVTVAQVVSAVAVTPAAHTLVAGDTLRLAAEAADANGHPVAGVELGWASSDTLVAVVDFAGLVTGVGGGEAEVTATAAGVAGRAQLTVVAPAPTAVAVTPDTVALTALGQTAQLVAEVRDQAGRAMEGVPVSWSSADTMVAAVDSAGLVTGVGGGATTVAATAGEVSGTAVVTVMQSAGSVVISPAADTVAPGDTLRLLAEAFDENGHRVRGVQFTWSSSEELIARVDGSGLVTGVAEGVATIIATAGDASGTSEITVANPDRAALVALYNATDGPNWVNNDNWLTGAPLGEWYGIEANPSGRVVRVDLAGRWDREARQDVPHGLEGPIPAALGSLTSLRSLDLGRNRLSGPIPPELGDLASLEYLDLGSNNLTGPIPPELGTLAKLTELMVWGNQLGGPIPPELGSLSSLRSMNLSGNNLTDPVPPELGRLTDLRWLWLSNNNLDGPIPPESGELANLSHLDLSWNDLTGSIPSEIGVLSNLFGLRLDHNALEGPVPPELGELANLSQLNLSENPLLWGPIPRSFLLLDGLNDFYAGKTDLCIPGVSAFETWVRGIENHDLVGVSPCNGADIAALKALYEDTGGGRWSESGGWLSDRDVDEWHGVTADSIGRVVTLDLASNGLAGQLPSSLGDLTRMTVLRIGANALSGRLPPSLAQVPLREFHYSDTELCAPVEASFQAWLDGISSHKGTGLECEPLSHRDVLEIFYAATRGPNWINNDDWLTDAPLADWFGVSVNGQGRVIRLQLTKNNLTGTIPTELGHLSTLTSLSLRQNTLAGPIPKVLASLANLRRLDLAWNDLTGPIPPGLGNLEKLAELVLWGNKLTGPMPPELGNLENLTELDLSGNSLTGPMPPELGNIEKLTWLALDANNLTGPIPTELGNLGNLEYLALYSNSLTGPIPTELGNLTALHTLRINANRLTGAIPPELGNLDGLNILALSANSLSGLIPPQLGNLRNLTSLFLGNNGLAGSVPPELGNLASLEYLSLRANSLTGPIPPALGSLAALKRLELRGNNLIGGLSPQLGNLSALEELRVESNDLTGSLPPELGGLASLREMRLTDNPAMAGPLPAGLTELTRLDALLAGGTDLCAPSDPDIQAWLAGVHKQRIKRCAEGDSPPAYLTQAVQSREFPVALVAGERALLRVFPAARQATSEGIPAVRARFYRNGREIQVEDIPGKSYPISSEVDESSLSKSANAEIAGEVIQPGLEMVIEVDPDGTLDPALGVAQRIPETGRLAVDVKAMPILDLTLIPFIWSPTHDSSIVQLVDAMAADPENHEMLSDTRTLLPVGDLVVTAHEPIVSLSNSAFVLRDHAKAIRVMEGGTGHYMAMMSGPVTGASGVAFLPGRASFSLPRASTIAHELGHNMNLQHAPCGGAGGPDPSFPYPTGSIGAWGYDFTDGGRLVHPSTPDLMSYCLPKGISDYSFTNALRYRLSDEGAPAAAVATRSLLLWGGIGADSVPYLEPAFVVEASPTLPDSAGAYGLTGQSEGGAELFSLAFTMPETADGDGSSSFAFVLPVRPGWENSLASITLTGPDGSTTLNRDSDLPMAILRNPRTGQIRGILRDPPAATQATAAAETVRSQGLEVMFSRGIPDPEAWRR